MRGASGAAVLACALLTGCAAGAQEPGATTLRVVLADDWAGAPVITEAIESFEQQWPGTRVQVDGVPFSQVPEAVTAAAELGEPYDLAHWHAFAAAAAGLAAPVDERWDAAGIAPEQLLPGAVVDVTWDSRRYGLPLDVNALVLLANGDRLREAGLAPAELRTLDGFATAAPALADLPSTDHALVVTASSWSAYGWILARGGQVLELAPDGTAALDEAGLPTFTFQHPGTIAALEQLVALVTSGAAPPPLAPDLATSAVGSFADGRAALLASGSWDLPGTGRAASSATDPAVEVLVLPLPQLDPDQPRTVLGGSSLFLPVDARNPELAFELARHLTSREVGVALVAAEGRLPARRDAYTHPDLPDTPKFRAVIAELEHAWVMPLIAYPEVATAFRDGLEAVLSLRSSPREAMAEVQRVAERWRAAA
ncbi:MAG: ABC transporter substrate-binding protein [Nitriliruptoraceae bacterium]